MGIGIDPLEAGMKNLNIFNIHLWWHGQNLNEKRNDYGKVIWRGHWFWHGRGWLHIGDRATESTHTTLGLEWGFGKQHRLCMFTLDLNGGDGDQIGLSLGIPCLIWLSFSVEGRWLRPIMPGEWRDSSINPGKQFWMPIERSMGIRIFDSAIWFSLWENPMESSCCDPWWWAFNFSPVDFFLGRSEYSKHELKTGMVDVIMPEGNYPAQYTIFESTWKRPRWPWSKHMIRAMIEPQTPIPVPGKGESSWDIGDTAVYSMTCLATSGDGAARRLTESCLRDRRRYGGPDWIPATR